MAVASVVIPAHNEQRVLGRLLDSLLHGTRDGLHGTPDGDLEIVVVPNGCTDGTADLALSYGPAVRVIESPIAGKGHALNVGDRAATVFPRFYVDADVVLSHEDIRRTALAMAESGALAAAPRLHADLDHASWAVRAWFRVWMRLPYQNDAMIGAGVYALSREGRARFERFPELIDDDLFVHRLFERSERLSVPDASFTIRPPATLSALIDAKTPIWASDQRRTREVDNLPAPPRRGALARFSARAVPLLREPSTLAALPIYAYAYAVLRVRGRRHLRRGHLGWVDEGEQHLLT